MALDKRLEFLNLHVIQYLEIKALTRPYDGLVEKATTQLYVTTMLLRQVDYDQLLLNNDLSLEVLECLVEFTKHSKYSSLTKKLLTTKQNS